jgi:hypothetical protein
MKEKSKVTKFLSNGFLDYKSPIIDAIPIKHGVTEEVKAKISSGPKKEEAIRSST